MTRRKTNEWPEEYLGFKPRTRRRLTDEQKIADLLEQQAIVTSLLRREEEDDDEGDLVLA